MTRPERDDAHDGMWMALVNDAAGVLAVDVDEMTPEEQDRLEGLSDPLIHLVGHAELQRPTPAADRDARFLEYVAVERIRRRHGASLLDDGERQVLCERILACLHASRLRVREVFVAPPTRRVTHARPADTELLAEAERRHEAVVPELAIAAGVGRELSDVECQSVISLPPDMPRGRYVALKVCGDSMEPLMYSGDLVLVKLGGRPMTGTVVVARDPDHGYVVKEVGRVTSRAIELLSLNPSYPPLRVPHATGTVLGTVLLRWKSPEGR